MVQEIRSHVCIGQVKTEWNIDRYCSWPLRLKSGVEGGVNSDVQDLSTCPENHCVGKLGLCSHFIVIIFAGLSKFRIKSHRTVFIKHRHISKNCNNFPLS
jgi:hypothetical protein